MISSQLFLLCIHFIFLLQNITSDTLYHALDYNSINFLTKWIWAILTMTSTASSGVAEREPGENKIYFFICFYSYFPPCSGEKICQKQILKSHQHSICAIITISSELDTDLDKKYTKKNNFHNKDANINEDYLISIWSWQQSWKYTKNFRFGDGGGFDAIGCQSSRNFHRDFNPKKIGFLFTS